ncbi:addiction module protein [Spirochaeta dissipatitropha]
MTKEAIIEEIRKHTPEEQREIVGAVWELAEDDFDLSEQQRSELNRRYNEYKRSASQGSTWQDVRARVEGSFVR